MIGIILSILKIVGIVILCILGFILAVLLLLLLCPFRYKVNAANEQQIEGKFRVTWLLHFVVAEVIYNQGINIRVKILGIPFFDKKRKEEKQRKRDEKNSKADSESNSEVHMGQDEANAEADGNDNDSIENIEVNDTSIKEDASCINVDSESEEESKEILDEAKKEKVILKITHIFDFIKSIPEKIGSFLENAKEKVDNLLETIDYYHRILASKGTEDVIEMLKKNLIKILKHICPRKSNIVVKYGSTDPDKLGSMCMYYGMASIFLPKKTYFYPDFEDDYFKFNAKIKGHIVLGYLALIGLSVILNKKLKKFIKLMKREKK